MRTATVCELRYRFPEIEPWLRNGEEVEIRRRGRVIARLVPIRPSRSAYPDFASMRREIFGKKRVHQTGTELVAEERSRF